MPTTAPHVRAFNRLEVLNRELDVTENTMENVERQLRAKGVDSRLNSKKVAFDRRVRAAKALAKLNHPRALTVLARHIDHPDDSILATVAQALEDTWHPHVLPAILAAATHAQFADKGVVFDHNPRAFRRDYFYAHARTRYGILRHTDKFKNHPIMVAFGHVVPFFHPRAQTADFDVNAYPALHAALQGALAARRPNPHPVKALRAVFDQFRRDSDTRTVIELPNVVYAAVKAAYDATESKRLLKGGKQGLRLFFRQLRDGKANLK